MTDREFLRHWHDFGRFFEYWKFSGLPDFGNFLKVSDVWGLTELERLENEG
jgi:hypothetical protein